MAPAAPPAASAAHVCVVGLSGCSAAAATAVGLSGCCCWCCSRVAPAAAGASLTCQRRAPAKWPPGAPPTGAPAAAAAGTSPPPQGSPAAAAEHACMPSCMPPCCSCCADSMLRSAPRPGACVTVSCWPAAAAPPRSVASLQPSQERSSRLLLPSSSTHTARPDDVAAHCCSACTDSRQAQQRTLSRVCVRP